MISYNGRPVACGLWPATLLKRDSGTGIFLSFAKLQKTPYLLHNSRRLFLEKYNKGFIYSVIGHIFLSSYFLTRTETKRKQSYSFSTATVNELRKTLILLC